MTKTEAHEFLNMVRLHGGHAQEGDITEALRTTGDLGPPRPHSPPRPVTAAIWDMSGDDQRVWKKGE